MSTLVAQTISNGTVSTSSANVIQGSAKAWVNFNGTGTPAIRASYNVSSITDNGTLSYRINFTNALPDANYCYVFGGSNVNDGTGTNYTGFYATTGGATTSSLSFVGLNIFGGGVNQSSDNPVVNVAIFD
jgi:hypothetical protein